MDLARGQVIACYIGDHDGDGLAAKAGVWVIRWAQRGAMFADTTHLEQVLALHADGTVDIGSATLRREHPVTGGNGVRIKQRVRLTRGHWRIYFCKHQGPLFDPARPAQVLAAEDGKRYDLSGAVASAVLRIRQAVGRWFCSEIVMHIAGFLDAWIFTPARAEAVIASYGVDVTEQFFNERQES
jgi:hypothetical protein